MISDKHLLVVQVAPFVSNLLPLGRVELLKEILVHFQTELLLFHRKVQRPQIVFVALQLKQLPMKISVAFLKRREMPPKEAETIFILVQERFVVDPIFDIPRIV